MYLWRNHGEWYQIWRMKEKYMTVLYTKHKRMHQEIRNDHSDLFYKYEMDSQHTIGSKSTHHFSQIWCYSLLQIRQEEKDIKEKTK